jgi:aspartyl-tRNA(Asn)/glutamyl-tRNA(Gln) amidotransferase subunit A
MDNSIAELARQLRDRSLSSVELTRHYLDRIAQLNPTLNAYITVDPEQALAEAAVADSRLAAGDSAPLLGVPVAHKDIFCTRGLRTSCASRMLDNFVPPYDATVVSALKQAGMVTLGKTNMDEFAMGSSNENSFYGPVRNPWQLDHVPGGSSGGSAAAVAGGLAPIATGTDTGGSIRQPAAFCGLTGLKPTYGRVSRYGMIAYASSLDQAGPIAVSAEDCALLLQAMAGFDPRDSTSAQQPVPDYTNALNQPLHGLRIGVPGSYFGAGLHVAVATAVREALAELEQAGASLHEIDLPHGDLALPAYYLIAPAEASANLARYDGVRYGYRCEDPRDLEDLYSRTRREGFGTEVKQRILVGTYALSAGYYDAYYRKAQQIRRLISEDFEKAFTEVDLIAGPTTPTTAFRAGSKTDDPVAMYLEDIYTLAVNLAGLPALSLPVGSEQGLPIGMQLIAPHFAEASLLRTAHQYQLRSNWHQQRAPLAAKGD